MKMQKRIFFYLSLIFLITNISIIYAANYGYTNREIPGLIPEINYSLIPTVNSSDFWDALDDPSDINFDDLTWTFADNYNYISGGAFTFNGTKLEPYAKYQFTDNNFNGSGNFDTTGYVKANHYKIIDTETSPYVLRLQTENTGITSDKALTFDVGNANRILTLLGNPTIDDWFNQGVKTTDDVYFNQITLTSSLWMGGNDIENAGTITGTALIVEGEGAKTIKVVSTNHVTSALELHRTGNPYYDWRIIDSVSDLIFQYSVNDGASWITWGTFFWDAGFSLSGDLDVAGIIINDAIYCESSELVDQTFAVAGDRYRLNISNIDEGNGISMSTGINGTNITIDTSGVYHLVAQPQVKAGAGGAGDFHMWIEKFSSGAWADIPDSNIELKLSSLEEDVIVLATTLKLNQGEKLRLVVSVSDNKILLHAQSPAGEPVIPSIIFTMYRIGS